MKHIRPIHSAEKQNFDTLVSAIQANRACLVSVFDTKQDQAAVLVCAVNHCQSESFEFVPLAMLCDDDPYSRFQPGMTEREDA